MAIVRKNQGKSAGKSTGATDRAKNDALRGAGATEGGGKALLTKRFGRFADRHGSDTSLRERMNDRARDRARLDLSKPRRGGLRLGVHYDQDAFGRFSEAIARFIGTARFLVFQTGFIIVWIFVNKFVRHFDGKQLGLLTLILSLQAAYAAPLILLAQNRQADRDRVSTERDRDTATRTQADTEFLARELASIRLGLSDVATSDELEKAIGKAMEKVLEKVLHGDDTLVKPRRMDESR
jgi:uncharacterized membrane protein